MLPIDITYIIIQVFQPYFYYSTTLPIVSFICVKGLAKYNPLLTARIRSVCYLFPLIIPVLLIVLTPPWLAIRFFSGISLLSNNLPNTPLLIIPNSNIIPPPISFIKWRALGGPLSITSILCTLGMVLSLLYIVVTMTCGDKIAKRIFHIVEFEPGEYKTLQMKIGELSRKLGVEPPRIGLVEDLRPNAFTIGFGRRTMLVFSLGILRTLKEKELVAVAAHELAHVKNHDFLFKMFSNTLMLLSFFNPFAYFSSSTAQREREILADEEGTRILGQPNLLAKTLVKIYEVSRVFPREGVIPRLASGLFLSSPVSMRSMLLSTHPKLDQRVENIRRQSNGGKPSNVNLLMAISVSLLIIVAGIMSTYYLASIQSSFIRRYLQIMLPKILSEKGFDVFKPGLDNLEPLWILSHLKLRPESFPQASTLYAKMGRQPVSRFPIGVRLKGFLPQV